jgi:glycosyltransferase involved in cell wall biosynthesis
MDIALSSDTAHPTPSGADTRVEVSVIVPCRNEEDAIEGCLQSILAQDPVPGGLEIIVADGLSSDRTGDIVRRIAKEDDRVRVIPNPGRIVSTGLNAAIAAARGQVIIRMDAHTLYARDYVRQCLDVLRETRADNVGGPALTRALGSVQVAIAAAYHSSFAVGGARFHDPSYEGLVDTVPYGCWPREVFERIGLFDEELVRNQDDEFNLRLVRAGGQIWQSPRIQSWYHTRASLKDLFRQYRQYGYWKVRVIQKHKLPASPRHLAPIGFLMTLAALSLVSLWWPPALWGLVGLVVMYLSCNVAASVATAKRCGWELLPILPAVFATYHVGYGVGFLRGMWDFAVLHQKRPGQSLISLSRGPAAP